MGEDRNLKTTVVIPVWDGYAGEVLRSAVSSLTAQQTDFRLIVVDNASLVAIGSPEGAEVIRAPFRLSLGAARNLGLSHVRTPYVVFWDADDVMLPGALSRLQHELESNPQLVAFAMAIRELPSGTRHRWPRRYLPIIARSSAVLAAIEPVWAQFPTTGATIMRAEAAREGGGFADADSGEDWCLGVSLAVRGAVGWTEDAGRLYRRHPLSMWTQHLTVSHQREHARAVRVRLRTDPAIPRWLRRAVPMVWTAQYAALTAHSVVAGARRIRDR